MNRKRAELVREARDARADARARLQRLPDAAAGATLAFARAHPWLVTGGALSLGLLGGASRMGSRGAKSRHAHSAALGDLSSWALSLAALALRFLPGLLRIDAPLQERQRSG